VFLGISTLEDEDTKLPSHVWIQLSIDAL